MTRAGGRFWNRWSDHESRITADYRGSARQGERLIGGRERSGPRCPASAGAPDRGRSACIRDSWFCPPLARPRSRQSRPARSHVRVVDRHRPANRSSRSSWAHRRLQASVNAARSSTCWRSRSRGASCCSRNTPASSCRWRSRRSSDLRRPVSSSRAKRGLPCLRTTCCFR